MNGFVKVYAVHCIENVKDVLLPLFARWCGPVCFGLKRKNNSLEYIDLRGNGVSKRDELFIELTLVHAANKYVDLPVSQRYALYHVLLTFCKEGVQDIFQYITTYLRVERQLCLTV